MSALFAGITGFVQEKMRMGDEARQRLKDEAEAKAQAKKDAFQFVARGIFDKDFVQGGNLDTPLFKKKMAVAGITPEDLTGLKYPIDAVDNTTPVGGLLFPWNHSSKTFKDGRADLEINDFNRWASQPKNLVAMAEAAKDPTNLRLLNEYIYKTRTDYTNRVLQTQSARAAGPGTAITAPAYPDFTNLQGFNAAADLLASLQPDSLATSKANIQYIMDQNVSYLNQDKTHVLYAHGNQGGTFKVAQKKVENIDNLNAFATANNYESPSHMMLDRSFVNANTLSKDPAVQFQSITNAAKLQPFYPKSLDEPFATTTDQKTQMGLVLEQVGGATKDRFYIGDMGAQVRAMVPHVDLKVLPSTGLMGVEISGAKFMTELGHKPSELTADFNAQVEAETLMNRLFSVEAITETTPGLIRIIQSGISGLVSDQGTLDQIFGFSDEIIAGSESYTTNLDTESGTTAKSLRAIAEARLGVSLESKLGVIKTLQINLAMKLARAADPSGRLSNQDFDNALKLLGVDGLFSGSKVRQLSALSETLNAVTKKRMSLEPLAQLVSKSAINDKDRKSLVAYERVKRVNRHMSLQRGLSFRGLGDEVPDQKVERSGVLPEGPKVLAIPENFVPVQELKDENTTFVFSRGDEGLPFGWYEKTSDGNGLISAAGQSARIRMLREQQKVK
jgi:hypothetical protein